MKISLLKLMKNSKHKKAINIALTVILIIICIAAAFIEFSESAPSWDEVFSFFGIEEEYAIEPTLKAHFIDVGQGDCTLIHSDDGAILIDAGEKGNEEEVIHYIKSQGIDSLDYVIATHPHSDHIGSLDEVIDAFTVNNVIMPKLSQNNTPTTSAYESLLESVKNSGARVISAKPGTLYSLGRLEMTILSPFEQSDNLNDMSVVVNIVFGETSFLFTGDAEKAAENLMLKGDFSEYLNVDVLKVAHHGSSSSTSKKFLTAVSPEVAVISCGKGNDYGHPHRETVALLNKNNIEMLRTDELGTVIIESDGRNIIY